MAINFFFDNIKPVAFPRRVTKSWIKQVCESKGFEIGDVNVIFCDDQKILEINRQFLNHDYFTDIITFDDTDYLKLKVNGEMYISLDTVSSNAEKFSQTFQNEFYRVIIHGFLHLMGKKDKKKEDALKMRELEELALSNLIF